MNIFFFFMGGKCDTGFSSQIMENFSYSLLPLNVNDEAFSYCIRLTVGRLLLQLHVPQY